MSDNEIELLQVNNHASVAADGDHASQERTTTSEQHDR